MRARKVLKRLERVEAAHYEFLCRVDSNIIARVRELEDWRSATVTEQQHAEALKESEARAWALVDRAAPFVNAVAVIAEDKAPSLGWLADQRTA